jgi:hypothetical protein
VAKSKKRKAKNVKPDDYFAAGPVAGRPFETLRILSRGALNSNMRIV